MEICRWTWRSPNGTTHAELETTYQLTQDATKDLLRTRRNLRLAQNGADLERLQVNINCRQAVRRDLQQYRERRLPEAASKKTSLKNCHRDLQDYGIPLSFLEKDGTLTTSGFEMEEVTRRFYTNLYRSTTHVREPKIPTGGTAPRIFPSEVRVAIASMETSTTPGPDKISADLLRAGGYELPALLATHMTTFRRRRFPTSGGTRGWSFFAKMRLG
ncbi:hypothetical protein V3C99_000055 [Haemonchus contortus]